MRVRVSPDLFMITKIPYRDYQLSEDDRISYVGRGYVIYTRKDGSQYQVSDKIRSRQENKSRKAEEIYDSEWE